MFALHFRRYDFRFKEEEGQRKVFDIVRKKWLVLTPEEWVRQHLVHHFITDLNYPRSLLAIEKGLTVNHRTFRYDIVVFNRDRQPWLLVECKRPEEPLQQTTADQAARYNLELQAPYMVITNGSHAMCFAINVAEKEVMEMDGLPVYDR